MGQRLIEQIDVGGPHQHPAESHALALPVGQLAGKPLEQVVDSQRGGHLVDPFGPLRVDYAVPVVKGKYDVEQNFNFGISTKF